MTVVSFGGLWGRAAPFADRVWVAELSGAMGFGLFALAAARLRRANPQQKALLAIALFAVAVSWVVAATRSDSGAAAALQSRYVTMTATAWIALLFLQGRLGATLALPVTALVVATQLGFIGQAEHLAAMRRAAIPSFVVGVDDVSALGTVIGYNQKTDYADLWTSRTLLKDRHLSVFRAKWPHWLGTRAEAHVVPPTARCPAGAFKSAVPLRGGGWRLVGDGAEPASILLLVDAAGDIAGFGVEDPGALGKESGGWWVGAATGDSSALSAWVWRRDGSLCDLGLPQAVQSPPEVSAAPVGPGGLALGGRVWMIAPNQSAKTIAVVGWALLRDEADRHDLFVDTDLDVAAMTVKLEATPEIARASQDGRLSNAGFAVTLYTAGAIPDKFRLCLWTKDAVFGRRLLATPAPGGCPEVDALAGGGR